MPVPNEADRSPIPRRLLRDEAERAIRDAILSGQFAPGEQLDEKELQAWLGISRTPVREALHGLQVQGLVEVAAQSYTRVAAPTPEVIGELVETMGVVLAGAVRLTTPHLSGEAVSSLVSAIDEASAAVAATDAIGHLDAATHFYALLLPYCPNKSLTTYIQSSLVALSYQYRANIGVRTTQQPALPASWSQLRRALLARDPEGAENAVRTMHGLP